MNKDHPTRSGIVRFTKDGVAAHGVRIGDEIAVLDDLDADSSAFLFDEADLNGILERSATARRVPGAAVQFLGPVANPGKILCLGLNYHDHAEEAGRDTPAFPAIFMRTASSIVGHGQPLVRPVVSDQLDWEGELVAVIGRRARHVAKKDALAHISGYSIFNDGSVRDFQRKSPQWTIGKNFDATGAFGPQFVPAAWLPPGATGLALTTTINGEVVQSANTRDMIFDVATTVELISACMTLEPGDLLVMGTPAGVGVVRKPPRFLVPGDSCEVAIEGIGVLRNTVIQEPAVGQRS